ncbi:valyl-tRNA synthetase [Sulfuricaulis limicola]|uniref:Valine--tRNA ligase n=1 Tax=Sulfuricaulis limicola TaxID=1620215 RepID=A0A1B4XEG5_9GAMM|nr:valine--tRNA ligase [Sulfuricaulis limicola]BAV33196.1 valyl-tRNA synthetase [Sulfuricaulis limicola]
MSQNPQKPAGGAPPENALSKSYDPHAIETRIYEAWERAGYFAASGQGAPYCIMIPPPNVTGSLHMGHAFQDTLMDTLIRYHRMQGDNTLWQAGTDHAGIATQMVVERQLEAEGKTRHDLGREEFVKRVWQWKAESGGTITRQLRRMGASLDWSRERFTMDDGLSHAVTEVFVRLHEEGLIYRGKRLVNWDPVLHTAVSDLEVVSEEEAGHLWHIRYPIAGTKEHLVVATTRPETMLGDTAVAVHPDDERYKKFIGKMVELPLTGRKIPVIADEYVDKEFGSGCVKITPAHDFNDYEVGKRHNLPLINIFFSDAGVNLPGSPYHNLDRFKARKQIVADLEARGLLERVQDHKLMVPRGDRTGAVIEPFLTDQWYVKVGPLAQEAIQCVEDGRIKFVPENWTKTYYEWMRNIQDWCISRQIWWGHRIPAWYDADGHIYVARNAAEAHAQARKKHGLEVPLEQDEDVLDTWFSSALWPFSTLGWPGQTKELKTFYPTSVLVTGFDIIFFWVARMIMMGLKFTGEVPFREVYIHGLVRDAHGQKMSKSKGNILDPIDLIDGIDLETLVAKRTRGLMQPQMAKKIEQATRKEFPNGIPAYGTDALRFTFASLATQGRDIKFDLGRIDGYRNFCNKLWNAARYVLMNTEGQDCGLSGKIELTAADRWIVSRQQEVAAEVESAFREYRFDLASQAIYSFIWHEYCDWYLELSKVVLTDTHSRPEQLRGTRRTLVQVLETALRMLHPVMPFITEEVWQRVAKLAGKTGATLMREPYPRPERNLIDAAASEEMRWAMAVITGVRNIRGEMDISPAKPLPLMFQDGSPADKKYLEANRPYLAALARAESITWLDKGQEAPESATALVGHMKVLIPLGSLIDKRAELERLGKEMDKLEKELAKAKTKLANPDFVARAPQNVVEQEQGRVQQFETALVNLRHQRVKVEALPG